VAKEPPNNRYGRPGISRNPIMPAAEQER